MHHAYTVPRAVCYKQAGCFVGAKRCPTRVATGKGLCCALAAGLSENKVSTQSLEQLRTWLGSKGVAVDKVAVIPSILDGSAMLVADRDVPSGDTILSVPDSFWLSPGAAAKRSVSGKLAFDLEPWLQIALALMAERGGQSKGQGEDWSTYQASTLGVLDSPLFWSEEQLQLLQKTQLLQSLLGYRCRLQKLCAETCIPWCMHAKDVCIGVRVQRLHAMQCVAAYCQQPCNIYTQAHSFCQSSMQYATCACEPYKGH